MPRHTWMRYYRCLTFCVVGALCAVLATQSMAERLALVVGNGAYVAAGTLPNPPNDAAAIAVKLQDMGFSVTQVVDADLQTMRASLETFGNKAAKAEIAVIFYAGHGMQADGENYLIPVDAQIASREDLATMTLGASEIFDQLLAAEPEVALLILDACRDNPFITAAATAAGLSTGTYSANAFVQRPNSAGMIIGFAAAPGAVAYDGGDGNSPYTTALLQWIDRPGLELGTMLRRVRSTVLDLTNGAQIPWVEEALLRDVFLQPADPANQQPATDPERLQLALLDTIRAMPHPEEKSAALAFFERFAGEDNPATVQLAAAVPGGDAPPEDALLQQGLIWLSIRSSTDPSVLQSFEAAFPDSPFALLARDRIQQLTTEQYPAPELIASAPDVSPGPEPSDSAPSPGSAASPPGDAAEPRPSQPVVDSVPILEPDTALALVTPPAPSAPPPPDPAEIEAALALDREALVTVQGLLAAGGDYAGGLDAIFGPGTRRAVARFQAAAALPDSGYLDTATLRALIQRRARGALIGEPDAQRRMAIHRVSAIASNGAGSVPVTLRVAALSRNDDVHAYWMTLARDFEADHPGTLVEFHHQPDWSYKANILSMLGSETPPDLIHTWGGGHLDALRDAGFVRDLTDEMAEGWALEFRPSALGNFASNGSVYGAPTFMALVSLWVNGPLLAKAGIAPEQLQTWDGFIAAIETLESQGIVPLAVGGRASWPFQMIWGNIALQLGGRAAFEAAYQGQGAGFRDPVFVEASERMRALGALDPFQPGYEDMSEDDAGNAFARGEAAMVVTGNWRLHSMGWNWPGGQDAMREQLLRLDFPGMAGAESGGGTYGGVDGFAVNSRAPDIAVDLLRLLTSRQVQARTAEIATVVPSVSGSDLAQSDPLIRNVAQAVLTSGYHQLYYDQVLGPHAGEVINDMAMRLAAGTVDAQVATDAIAQSWERVLVGRGIVPESAIRP